jgi:hypothetical protein
VTRQNRVLPTGQIVATDERGTLTGNRGCLHDAEGRLGTARWRHPHWIACELSYKGWRRPIMAPNRWTELFFLDEAVALAAGHRPCALCRHSDWMDFRAAWTRAFGTAPAAPEIDRVLHAARIDSRSRAQRLHEVPAVGLPDGTFISHDGTPALICSNSLRPYRTGGYGIALPRPEGRVTVLTPYPIVAVLAAGYRPRLHPTAQTAEQGRQSHSRQP